MTSTPARKYFGQTAATWRKTLVRVAIILTVPVAVGFLHTATEGSEVEGPAVHVAAASAARAERAPVEEWWTTTACDHKPEYPCVDPSVDPADIPDADARSAAENQRRSGDCEARGLATDEDYTCAPAPAAAPVAVPGRVTEDSAAWSCTRNGNHVCGPGNPQGAPAGCYRAGQLVIPWSNYANPKADQLYAQQRPPC